MSVPAPLRNKTPLEAQIKVDEMVGHTIHIMANEKVFDPTYHVFGDHILDTAINISKDVWEANEIRVRKNPNRWQKRSDLQQRALDGFERLYTLMRIAKTLYHLRSKKYSAWVYKVSDAEEETKKWVKSDRRRFKSLS